MEIKTADQVEEIRQIIGDQNTDGCKLLLADGGRMWFFRLAGESQSCSMLNDWEKGFCAGRFDAGATWAGIVRVPKQRCMPGIIPCSCHDPHGNPIR